MQFTFELDAREAEVVVNSFLGATAGSLIKSGVPMLAQKLLDQFQDQQQKFTVGTFTEKSVT